MNKQKPTMNNNFALCVSHFFRHRNVGDLERGH